MTDMTDKPDATPDTAPDVMEGQKRAAEAGEGGGKKHEAGGALPPLDFTSFILSLSSSVLMHLGVIENPVTKKTEKELPVARQTIDIIELLKDKTAGNLSEEEAQLMENVLRELKMLYVKAVG